MKMKNNNSNYVWHGLHGEHINELIPNNIQSEIFADVGRLMNNQTSGSVSYFFFSF